LKTIDGCPSTLEGNDYNENFVRRITDKGHYKYVLPSDEAENDCHFLLFGQICHSAVGTQLSSRGNKTNYNNEAIDDKTGVKHIIVLSVPSNCDKNLAIAFNDQLATLSDIRVTEDEEDNNKGKNPIIKSWFHWKGDTREAPDMLAITTDYVYGFEVTSKYANRPVKQKAKRSAADAKLDNAPSSMPIPSSSAIAVPSKADLKLNGLYDPHLLPNYGGACFKHQKSKLKQLNVRDTSNDLVPPWELYTALKPGTLILADVTLHCYVFDEPERGRKAYQISAHTIHIVDGSDEKAEARQIPVLPIQTNSPTTDLFAFPSKKKKMDMNI